MNQMNGTFTLAFVEEDNKQRVIFRVAPLSTREGISFRSAMDVFPDEGSLRVVPDKREQSTFKERMRAMGSLCVISLTGSEGKELVKVRQNKNYDPEQGEKNQLAIYSDVIQEFAPGAVFEVLSWQESGLEAEKLLTKDVLLLSNKVLYGPVAADQIASVQLAELKPFGNDRFLLHTVELPDHGVHTLYWNPEETINWRQRRGSLHRRADRGAKEAKEEKEEEVHSVAKAAPEDHLMELAAELAAPMQDSSPPPFAQGRSRRGEREEPLLPESPLDEVLPIGSRLSILEPDISFDEQISRLDQPVSDHANRLNAKVAAMKLNDTRDTAVRFLGTPLVREVRQGPKAIGKPEPLHRVVEQQLKAASEERVSGELRGAQLARMENPIENLLLAVEGAWQDRETRSQAVAALVENQGFVDSLLEALRRRGQDSGLVAAAYAQLEELEAERFQILMELDLAKAEQRKYKEELLTATSQKKREEIEALNQEIQVLAHKKQELEEALRALSYEAQASARHAVGQNLRSLGGLAQDRVLLSPVVGQHHGFQDMVRSVHGRMNARGFRLSEDDALSLLILFSQFPIFCLRAGSLENAQLFATTLLEALGLQSVSATLYPEAILEIASLLPEDERRTPTVSLQLADTQALSLYGHRTVYLSQNGERTQLCQGLEPYPVMAVPPLVPQGVEFGCPLPALPTPAALSSFLELGAAATPLLEEWEEWFEQFHRNAAHAEVAIPEATLLCMRRFVSVASQTHRGGFLDAVDRAMTHWVVPHLMAGRAQAARIQEVLKGFPRSLEAVMEKLPL